MSKELEALKRIRQETCPATYMDDFDKNEFCDVIEQALKRLEAIDNANPSEALECLNKIVESFNETTTGMYGLGEVVVANDLIYGFKEELETIEQALLKAQEPKHYLKWEDLEFSFKDKYMKVKLNGNIYTLRYTRNALMEFPVAYLEFGNTEITIIDCKKQFFNDLHLERVEE